MTDVNKNLCVANYLLNEIDGALSTRRGSLFKQMLADFELVDGWYVVNTEEGTLVGGPYVRAYHAYDKAAELNLDADKLDIVRIRSSKLMKSMDFSGQPFSTNLPSGWYVVNSLSKIILKGPMNQSQAKLYSKGDYIPQEANGKYK